MELELLAVNSNGGENAPNVAIGRGEPLLVNKNGGGDEENAKMTTIRAVPVVATPAATAGVQVAKATSQRIGANGKFFLSVQDDDDLKFQPAPPLSRPRASYRFFAPKNRLILKPTFVDGRPPCLQSSNFGRFAEII